MLKNNYKVYYKGIKKEGDIAIKEILGPTQKSYKGASEGWQLCYRPTEQSVETEAGRQRAPGEMKLEKFKWFYTSMRKWNNLRSR